MKKTKKLATCAFCVALCVVLPLAFHLIPDFGSVFCPMHLPVFVCAMLCGPVYGIVCGLLGPLFSSLFTGMPPSFILPSMLVELATYGLLGGLLMNLFKSKKLVNLYIVLALSMLIGRLIACFVQIFIFAKGTTAAQAIFISHFVTCLPGTILQLLIIPPIVLAISKLKISR